MYAEGNYVINWFLGYKTARLVYSLALLFITSYLDFEKKQEGRVHLRKSTVVIFIMCIFSAYRSQATGASTALLLYAFLICVLKMHNDKKNGKGLYLLYNSRNIILGSGIVYYLVMTIEKNVFVQNIVKSIFNKSITLSNRTIIWKNCMEFFKQSPIIGKGIFTTLEYKSISKYFLGTNAHNLLLTLLVSGGIVAVVMYLLMLKISMTRKNLKYTKQEVTLISAIIVFIFLGISSSTLVFSAFAFLPFVLLEYEKIKKKEEKQIENNCDFFQAQCVPLERNEILYERNDNEKQFYNVFNKIKE